MYPPLTSIRDTPSSETTRERCFRNEYPLPESGGDQRNRVHCEQFVAEANPQLWKKGCRNDSRGRSSGRNGFGNIRKLNHQRHRDRSDLYLVDDHHLAAKWRMRGMIPRTLIREEKKESE